MATAFGVSCEPSRKTALETLPALIPLIVHHSDTGWTAPQHFAELFEPTVRDDAELSAGLPHFRALLDDLSFRSDADLRNRAMSPEATLAFLFLRDGRRDGRVEEQLAAWADLFRLLLPLPNGRRAIRQLISYLLRVAPRLVLEDLIQQVHQVIPETESEIMPRTRAQGWSETNPRSPD